MTLKVLVQILSDMISLDMFLQNSHLVTNAQIEVEVTLKIFVSRTILHVYEVEVLNLEITIKKFVELYKLNLNSWYV